jgi:hypothetical protein
LTDRWRSARGRLTKGTGHTAQLHGLLARPARSAAVAPTAAATDRFLARLGTAFPGTVWVGGCKNWYTSQQPTPVLWPFPQSEHKAFFEQVPVDDFQFIPSGQGD